MAFDFSKIATKKVEDVERPPLPPTGTYEWAISKIPSQDEYGDDWFTVNFPIKAVRATEDVDPDALAAYLTDKNSGRVKDISSIELRKSFVFDKNDAMKAQGTEADLTEFLTDHCKCAEDGMSIKEAMNNSVHAHFLGAVKWKARKDNAERFDANIGKTAPVE